MSEIAQGALTLGAVLVGGIVSYAGGTLSERSRWKRERSSRWDQRRLDAYVDFARAVKEESRVAMRIAAGRDAGPKSDPLDLVEGRRLYATAEHQRSTLFEAVLLLGDDATVSAGRMWYRAVWTSYQYVSKERVPDGLEFVALYTQSGEARDLFYDAARSSLDIHGVSGESAILRDEAEGKY